MPKSTESLTFTVKTNILIKLKKVAKFANIQRLKNSYNLVIYNLIVTIYYYKN